MLFRSTRVSYAELDEWIARVAGGLVGLGIQKGDRVAIWLPNGLEWAVTFLGASSRITVDLGDATTVMAQLPTSDATALPAGSAVALTIRPDPVLIA